MKMQHSYRLKVTDPFKGWKTSDSAVGSFENFTTKQCTSHKDRPAGRMAPFNKRSLAFLVQHGLNKRVKTGNLKAGFIEKLKLVRKYPYACNRDHCQWSTLASDNTT